MQRGVLTGKMKPGQKFGAGDTRKELKYYNDENIIRINTLLGKLKPLADEKHATVSQLVIRWTIEQPGITIALVGARNAEQAVQNAKTAEIKLSAYELKFISDELNKLALI